jgi:hypothetical protein
MEDKNRENQHLLFQSIDLTIQSQNSRLLLQKRVIKISIICNSLIFLNIAAMLLLTYLMEIVWDQTGDLMQKVRRKGMLRHIQKCKEH